MVGDSFLAMACAATIMFLFGLALTFAGYRLFLLLIPIFGFFFGLVLGAQAIQALFGEGFLSTVTSWVVGFIVGAVFAVLSYLFYFVAVAVIAGALGYGASVAVLEAIGLDFGLLVWVVGIVAAIALAIVTIRFNLQKYVIIAATSILGAGVVGATIVALFNPWEASVSEPVKTALNASPLVVVLFIALAIIGIIVQYQSTKPFTIEDYNRWEEYTTL